jgi:hypothetical protein
MTSMAATMAEPDRCTPSGLLAKLKEPLPQLVDRNEKGDAYRLMISAAERDWLIAAIPAVEEIGRLRALVANKNEACRLALAEVDRRHVENAELREVVDDLVKAAKGFGALYQVQQKARALLAKATSHPCDWARHADEIAGVCVHCGGKWTSDAPIRPPQCLRTGG